MLQPYELHITVLNFPRPVPDIHDRKEDASYDQRNITTMREFVEIGCEKDISMLR